MKIFDVLTIAEAAELWNKEVSTLRRNFAKGTQFKIDEDIRKSGNTWLVTRKSMERVYGTMGKNICVEIRGEIEDLGMEYNLEFEWDGNLSDGHFYILDNSNLENAVFNLVRDKLDIISSKVNNAYKKGYIREMEDIF